PPSALLVTRARAASRPTVEGACPADAAWRTRPAVAAMAEATPPSTCLYVSHWYRARSCGSLAFIARYEAHVAPIMPSTKLIASQTIGTHPMAALAEKLITA